MYSAIFVVILAALILSPIIGIVLEIAFSALLLLYGAGYYIFKNNPKFKLTLKWIVLVIIGIFGYQLLF